MVDLRGFKKRIEWDIQIDIVFRLFSSINYFLFCIFTESIIWKKKWWMKIEIQKSYETWPGHIRKKLRAFLFLEHGAVFSRTKVTLLGFEMSPTELFRLEAKYKPAWFLTFSIADGFRVCLSTQAHLCLFNNHNLLFIIELCRTNISYSSSMHFRSFSNVLLYRFSFKIIKSSLPFYLNNSLRVNWWIHSFPKCKFAKVNARESNVIRRLDDFWKRFTFK